VSNPEFAVFADEQPEANIQKHTVTETIETLYIRRNGTGLDLYLPSDINVHIHKPHVFKMIEPAK
jgi:hypothetical protein